MVCAGGAARVLPNDCEADCRVMAASGCDGAGCAICGDSDD